MDYQRVTRRVELDLIAALADAALAEVERHCGRLFAPAAGGEPRRVITELDVGAPLWLSVAPGATAPTMTVQAVEQWDDDASAWEAASADAYEVGPGGRTWRPGAAGGWRITTDCAPGAMPPEVLTAVQRLSGFAYGTRTPGGENGLPSLAGAMLKTGAAAMVRRYREVVT